MATWRGAPHRELWGPIPLCSLCSGWIAALSTMKHNLAVSVIMMVVAGFFTLCAVLSLFLLKRVSGGCRANCKPKEAPAPGVGTSLLLSPWGMFITTAVASPGSSELQQLPPRLWVGGQTGWGPWWLPWAHELVAPRRVDFSHRSLFLQGPPAIPGDSTLPLGFPGVSLHWEAGVPAWGVA